MFGCSEQRWSITGWIKFKKIHDVRPYKIVYFKGRSIAELQVMGIKSTFTKRPYDTSVTLTVHSLLIVDALQTFGPDFELLVASHKNIRYFFLFLSGVGVVKFDSRINIFP